LAIVKGRSEAGRVLDVPIWFSVKALARVVVADQELAPGALLDEVAVRIEDREIQGLNAQPAESVAAFEGMRVAGRIAEGDVITLRQLEPLPSVRRGQAITLTARRSNIQVATQVVALEDGNIGDVISGHRVDGEDELRMRVVAHDQAEVVRP
jgi:flagella basal body P-ring formation protein FlgA